MDPSSLKTFSTVAYDCLTKCRKDRPSMTQIMEQLQKALDEQLAVSSGLWHDSALHQELPTSEGNGITLTSSSSQIVFSNDVFICYMEEDSSCMSFVDDLYSAIVQRGIDAYLLDQKLLAGEDIGPSLRIAVIILSEKFADSSWCLNGLAYIMKCEEERGQIVIPIFYGVDPSDVRKQRGRYGIAFGRYHESQNKNVDSWIKALTHVAYLSGWATKGINDGVHEGELVKKIVDGISRRLGL